MLGSKYISFVVIIADFSSTKRKLNTVYFSRNIVYILELIEVSKRFYMFIALLNLSFAVINLLNRLVQITINAKQAVQLV